MEDWSPWKFFKVMFKVGYIFIALVAPGLQGHCPLVYYCSSGWERVGMVGCHVICRQADPARNVILDVGAKCKCLTTRKLHTVFIYSSVSTFTVLSQYWRNVFLHSYFVAVCMLARDRLDILNQLSTSVVACIEKYFQVFIIVEAYCLENKCVLCLYQGQIHKILQLKGPIVLQQ